MDRIEQRLRDVFLHSLGPGDTLPDAEAVIFSILPILAILSCCSRRLLRDSAHRVDDRDEG